MAKENVEETPLTVASLLTLFQKMQESQNAQFQQLMQTVVAEIRKPPVDPVKEVQKARAKEAKEKGEKEFWEKKALRKKNCLHTRQNGTSNIAWATQSDGIERGYCPYCDSTFTPEDGDLYIQLRKMPRGMVESIRYVS